MARLGLCDISTVGMEDISLGLSLGVTVASMGPSLGVIDSVVGASVGEFEGSLSLGL